MGTHSYNLNELGEHWKNYLATQGFNVTRQNVDSLDEYRVLVHAPRSEISRLENVTSDFHEVYNFHPCPEICIGKSLGKMRQCYRGSDGMCCVTLSPLSEHGILCSLSTISYQ